jgi:hypothetical protein
MANYGHQDAASQETAPLLPKQPMRKPKSRRPSTLGIVVAATIFAWWSLYAIPSILSLFRNSKGKDHAKVESFEDVCITLS